MSDWYKKKILGDFGEMICKHHFEIMGYTVDKTGIEELSPAFATLQSDKKPIASIKEYIQKIPDFLAVCPHSKKASFIEVKYRAGINKKSQLKEFSDELHTRYQNLVSQDIPIYFYLVTNIEPYIFIMKANSFKYKEKVGGFYTAGADKSLGTMPFFVGAGKNPRDFNEVYFNEIKPSLQNIFK